MVDQRLVILPADYLRPPVESDRIDGVVILRPRTPIWDTQNPPVMAVPARADEYTLRPGSRGIGKLDVRPSMSVAALQV